MIPDAKIIVAAWNRTTSVDPEGWHPTDRAYGQDDVTALVLHDFMGGSILRAEIEGWPWPHYWNLGKLGVEIDMTIFRYRDPVVGKITQADITAMISDERTAYRYDRLARRLRDAAFVLQITAEEYSGPEYEAA